jgi:hypothetical protein
VRMRPAGLLTVWLLSCVAPATAKDVHTLSLHKYLKGCVHARGHLSCPQG